MKKTISLLLIFLLLLSLSMPLVGCAKDDTATLKGQWLMVSYVTLDGVDAAIENNLYMLFFGNGYGETKSDEEIYQSFTYQARGGNMTREVDLGNGAVEVLEETYELSEGGTRLTLHTPASSSGPGATIVLQKIAEQNICQ